jgi:hypothetical protein
MEKLHRVKNWVSRNPVVVGFGASMILVGSAMATPTSYDFRSASSIPTDMSTIIDNAILSVPLFTGGAVTLVALKATIPLVAGLVRGLFSS